MLAVQLVGFNPGASQLYVQLSVADPGQEVCTLISILNGSVVGDCYTQRFSITAHTCSSNKDNTST